MNKPQDMWKQTIRFLVVDDEAYIRKLVITRLRHDGYKGMIYEAKDGQEALDIFYDKEIDCIISDWNMPKITGIEFLDKIKQGAAGQSLAVLMVTGESTLGKMEEALDCGADDFLTKPFDPEDFKRKVEKVLDKIKKRKMGTVTPSSGEARD